MWPYLCVRCNHFAFVLLWWSGHSSKSIFLTSRSFFTWLNKGTIELQIAFDRSPPLDSWPWHRALRARVLSSITSGQDGFWWSESWDCLGPFIVHQLLPLPVLNALFAVCCACDCRLKGAPPLICPLNIQILLINLKRRLDRRTRMLKTFAALGLQATLKDAVDGKYVARTRD